MSSQIIRGVRQTEKGARIARHRQYILQVVPEANKAQIKQEAEALFQVSVVKVTTQNYDGKWRRLTGRWGRRPAWKKAFVTVAEGQKIELK
ncbi:MAG: 50S ribosomal protein L23 [Candidatus Omnitrophica bacterium]|nr:50S ribosomal protein L23 [Candidatus Omnitrophota bacterium]